MAQIREIDSTLGHAAEAYNLANIQLAVVEKEQRRNARSLALAQANLRLAQRALQARLVAIYTSGQERGSTVEVLLGATSIDDLINRIDTVDRVSSQDARVLREVVSFRAAVGQRRTELVQARAEQARTVEARAAQKVEIERRLAERQTLLGSIRGQLARLEAEERARQQLLIRQARARLAAEATAVAARRRAAARQRAAARVQPDAPAVATSPVEAAVVEESPVETTVQEAVEEAPLEAPIEAAAAPEAVESAETAAAAPAARYGGVVSIAMGYLGTPYLWGGASPSGFDCSGFIMYVYAKLGVSLPHNAAAQYGMGTPVSKSDLQPGDLVFFDGLGHNGIYIGGDQFIHSPHSGDVVKISGLSDSWYASTWVGARRL